MSNLDPNLLELFTAIVGTIAAVAAATGAAIQLKAAKLEQRSKQHDQETPSAHPKQSADRKPPK
jgi:hypothetical protein